MHRVIAADSSVEYRVAMEEVDCKPELIAIIIGRYLHVRHKHNRYPLLQP